MIRRAAGYALGAIFLAWVMLGCGAPAREKTISATLTATQAAAVAFVSFDGRHQLDIVAEASSKPEGQAALLGWHVQRDKVQQALVATFETIAAAATINDEQSVAAMLKAAAQLRQALDALGVKL
jgi:hypothetical protein